MNKTLCILVSALILTAGCGQSESLPEEDSPPPVPALTYDGTFLASDSFFMTVPPVWNVGAAPVNATPEDVIKYGTLSKDSNGTIVTIDIGAARIQSGVPFDQYARVHAWNDERVSALRESIEQQTGTSPPADTITYSTEDTTVNEYPAIRTSIICTVSCNPGKDPASDVSYFIDGGAWMYIISSDTTTSNQSEALLHEVDSLVQTFTLK